MTTPNACTISIAPGTRHLGFAVFRGQNLVRFGVKNLEGEKAGSRLSRDALKYLNALSARFSATSLVVEDPYYAQAKRSRALKHLTTEIKKWGCWKRLAARSFSPPEVKRHFCSGKGTRSELAQAIAHLYPFLQPYLRPGRTQRARMYWFQMFDAVALGILASRRSQVAEDNILAASRVHEL